MGSLGPRLLVLYLGYSEMENKRLEELVFQVWEAQTLTNNSTWILYRGKEKAFNQRYPSLAERCSKVERRFKFGGSVSPVSETKLSKVQEF